MVRIDRNTPASQPHNAHPAKGAKGAQGAEPALMQSVADKIKSVAPGNISAAGRHTFTRNAPNKSEAKDVHNVARPALNAIGQLMRGKK